jgi:hypothetical protein
MSLDTGILSQGLDMKLITHLHLVPQLRMSEPIPLLPLGDRLYDCIHGPQPVKPFKKTFIYISRLGRVM